MVIPSQNKKNTKKEYEVIGNNMTIEREERDLVYCDCKLCTAQHNLHKK